MKISAWKHGNTWGCLLCRTLEQMLAHPHLAVALEEAWGGQGWGGRAHGAGGALDAAAFYQLTQRAFDSLTTAVSIWPYQ